ncbi:MAG TPA: AprI/Inh family metalloprotease inhibitor [Beijerinckiaceae bacterium]|jgi:hypothetical protein|nr:hypothetical protein [Microvirga sp.]HZB36820.1 AprI/Inh family metalloprotease inhibitor [Beijerinckiaceae bacterium]
MDRARRLRPAGAFAALLLTGASPPAPPDVAAVSGAWDIVLEGSHRKCRINLSLDAAGIGRALRFPAGCRRALPALREAGGWTIPERGALRLVDAMGEAALEFKPNGANRFVATTGTGETYRLEREEEARLAALPPPAPAPPIGVPQLTPVDPAKAPPAASLPGTYLVDRYTEREVCRLALMPTPLGGSGLYEARLLEGCRDQGLRTFDPLTWRYERGRLTLMARRGHEVTLISERDGHWRRDPEVGATLILRKAGP